MYYNTTNEVNHELQEYKDKAKSQELEVVKAAKLLYNRSIFITCETLMQYFSIDTPITSIRRAVTDLTNDGILEKRGKIKGSYGRNIFVYKLKTN
jgi:predicted transcriptional regulator